MNNPILRFPKESGNTYPDWNIRTIESLCENILGGGTPSKSNTEYWEGTIPWISSSDLSLDKIRGFNVSRFISQDAIKHNSAKIIKKGSVLIVSRVGVGKVAVAPFNLCTSQDFTNLISVKCNRYFLAYALARMMKFKSKAVQGTAIKGIPASELKQVSLAIPCEEEQQKIASFFATLDEKIELSERKLEALEQLKKGLMQKIFNQEIRFKRSDGSMYKNWEGTRISRLFSFIRNGFVGTIAPHYTDKNNGIRYLQGTNIHNGRISDNVEYYVTKEFNQAHSKNILKHDDILMVQSGHVGECAVVGNYAGSNCHALIIMSNAGTCSSDYIRFYFESSIGKRQLALISVGNTVKHILASDVSKLSVLIPEIEEQEKIANLFLSIEKRIDIVEKQLESLKQLKKGFMQQMFV